MKWLAAMIGAIIGYNVGLGVQSHGGPAWPTLIFCGPAWVFAAPFGDNMGYVYAVVTLTTVLYAVYGMCLVQLRSWKVLLTIALIHSPFAILALVVFLK